MIVVIEVVFEDFEIVYCWLKNLRDETLEYVRLLLFRRFIFKWPITDVPFCFSFIVTIFVKSCSNRIIELEL